MGARKERAKVSWLPLLPRSFLGPSPPCLPSPLSPSWFPPPTSYLQDEAPRGSFGKQENRGAEQGLWESFGGCGGCQTPPATPTWLCFGIRGHFSQALEVKQRATGPLEVSSKVFTREEKKECLLDGECGGHRCRVGPETSPLPPGVWGREGHSLWECGRQAAWGPASTPLCQTV